MPRRALLIVGQIFDFKNNIQIYLILFLKIVHVWLFDF
jgi:hypothetical protein